MKTTIADIKAAYTQLLRDTFPGIKIYGNAVHDGYDRPSFFVEARPVNRTRISRKIIQEGARLTTTYFESTHDEKTCLEIYERISDMVGPYIKVGSRKLPVRDIDMEWAGSGGDMLQIDVELETFAEITQDPETGDMMETVSTRLNR